MRSSHIDCDRIERYEARSNRSHNIIHSERLTLLKMCEKEKSLIIFDRRSNRTMLSKQKRTPQYMCEWFDVKKNRENKIGCLNFHHIFVMITLWQPMCADIDRFAV